MTETRTRETFTKWDAADYIETEEDALYHILYTIEEDEDAGLEGRLIRRALGDIARAQKRMNGELANDIDVGIATLYRAVSESGNPSFETVYKLIRALGFRLRVELAETETETVKT